MKMYLVILGIVLLVGAPVSRAADSTLAERRAAKTQKDREDLEHYYADLFGEPLKQKNRLGQLLAIVSLSRIDAAPIADKLIEAAGDKDWLVAQVAWEALFAGHASLTPAQREQWLEAGLSAARNGAFPGQTASSLVSAVAGYAYQADGKLIADLIERCADTPDQEGLKQAIAQLYKGQPDRVWLRLFVNRVMRGDAASKYDELLRALPDAPAKPEKASQLMGVWQRFAAAAPPATTQPVGAFTATSPYFPRPEKIENPYDPKWTGELELPNLNIRHIELVYVIDSTGSMGEPNKLLAETLQPLTLVLSIIAPDVRAGVVYYRHEINPALQKDCCKQAAHDSSNHLIHAFPLSPNVAGVVSAMQNFYIAPNAGHYRGNGAYAAGLEGALRMNWLNDRNGQRIVIVIGDALPTEGSVEYATQCATALKAKGVSLFFLEMNAAAAKAVAPIAQAGGQEPKIFQKDLSRFKALAAKQQSLSFTDILDSTVGQTLTGAVKESVPAQYHDRVDTVLKTVYPILEQAKASR